MKSYHCARCGRSLPGPEGMPCPWCARRSPSNLELLVAVLVGLAIGAAMIWGAL